MPVTRNYDDVDPMFKLNSDGESASIDNVLGKTAVEKKLAEGYRYITELPWLPFPTGVYRDIPGTKYGEFKRIDNRAQLNEALAACDERCLPNCRKHGWDRKVRAAAPPPEDTTSHIPIPVPQGPNAGTVELALALVEANTRASQQEQAITELRQQHADILAQLQKSAAPKGKPGRKPKIQAESQS